MKKRYFIWFSLFLGFICQAGHLEDLRSKLKNEFKEELPIFYGKACKKIYHLTAPIKTEEKNPYKNKFDEDKYFNMLKNAVASAKKEIMLMTYAIKFPDQEKLPKSLLYLKEGIDLLKERLQKEKNPSTVHIYILSDHNVKNKSGQYLETLFNDTPNDHIEYHKKIFKHNLLGSIHTKLFMVDAQFGMATGANILEDHFRENGWFDQSMWIYSPTLWGYARENIFLKFWNEATDIGMKFTPQPITVDNTLPFLPCNEDQQVKVGIGLIFRGPTLINITRTLKNRSTGLLAAMNFAKKSIKILTPNLNAPGAVNAIKKALERKVKVKILLTLDMNEKVQAYPIIGGGNNKTIAKKEV